MKFLLLVKGSFIFFLTLNACSTEDENLTQNPALPDGTYTKSQIVCADDTTPPFDATWAAAVQAAVSALPDPQDTTAVQSTTATVTGSFAALKMVFGYIQDLSSAEIIVKGNSITETTVANNCNLSISKKVKINLDNAFVTTKEAVHTWTASDCSFNAVLGGGQATVPSTLLKTTLFADSTSTDSHILYQVSQAGNVYTLSSSTDESVVAAVKKSLGGLCAGKIKFTLTRK